MPLPEIPWRVWEKAKKKADQHRSFTLPDSTARPAVKVFSLAENTDHAQLKSRFSTGLNTHFAIADAALENRFNAFDMAVSFQGRIDWHLDPKTRKNWPKKFWGNINIRDKSLGGVKLVWEINRLYCLVSLGLCFHMTRQEKYGREIGQLIQSWNDQNPYPLGVNWVSGIEAGVRLANLVWALSFLKDYDFSSKELKAINCFVWCHARHLHWYPSRYSSANNHLLAEAFGMFVAGLYFPHLPGAHKWLAEGSRILDQEAERQILPDGGSFEYSTTYLSFVVDFFLLYRQICRLQKRTYSPMVDERLEKACDYIGRIMDAGGNVPNIGDQDSAVLVNFGLDNAQNFSSILNTGAVLFNKTQGPFSGPDIKTFLLTGSGGPERQPCLGVSQHLFKHPGLAVIRDRVNDREVLFTGNATPMGMAPLYAHGHLDALSFTLSVDGLPVFVDPGTYLYQGGGKWREYFRSTAAHNTLRINRTDFSSQPGDFMYGRPYRITHNRLARENGTLVWTAGHDAYARAPFKAAVQRKVVWNLPEIVITDQVRAGEPVFVELFFHCHPDCRVEKENNVLVIQRQDVRIGLTYDPSLACEIFHGSRDPLMGWYSPAFNQLAACDTIRLSGSFDKQCSLTCGIQIH